MAGDFLLATFLPPARLRPTFPRTLLPLQNSAAPSSRLAGENAWPPQLCRGAQQKRREKEPEGAQRRTGPVRASRELFVRPSLRGRRAPLQGDRRAGPGLGAGPVSAEPATFRDRFPGGDRWQPSLPAAPGHSPQQPVYLGDQTKGTVFPSVTAGTSGVPSPRSRHLPRASQELMFPLRSPGPPIKYRLSWPSLPAPPFSLHWLPDLYFVSALGTRGPLSVSLSPCPWRQQRPACRRLQRTCQRHRGVKNVPLAGARGS